MTRASLRFRAWTDTIGCEVAARMIGCDPSFVSHLRAGRKVPGLTVAVRIERATRGWRRGPITCASWVPLAEVAAA